MHYNFTLIYVVKIISISITFTEKLRQLRAEHTSIVYAETKFYLYNLPSDAELIF